MPNLRLPFGKTELVLELPSGIAVEIVSPASVKPAPNPVQAIAAALDSPIQAPRLEDMARAGQRVAVVVDDITRPTPVSLILPLVIGRLETAGVRSADITVVLALGTHRPMTDQEIVLHVGPEIAQRYCIVNTNGFDTEQLTDLGMSPLGVPVQLNRAVVEADWRIGIGNIVPHSDAGWGGGAKILYPGVAGKRTVEALHVKSASHLPDAFGSEISAVREDIEALVGEVGLEFIVNTILAGNGQIFSVVAGHFVQAHRAGVCQARRVYGVPVSVRPDVVVVNSHPTDLDFWQASKAIFAGARIVRPGGHLLLVAPCSEGIGPHPLLSDYLGCSYDDLSRRIEQGKVDEPIAASGALQLLAIRRMCEVSIYSPGLDPALVSGMGFRLLPDLQAAMDALDATARVAIITHGGESCPFIVGS